LRPQSATTASHSSLASVTGGARSTSAYSPENPSLGRRRVLQADTNGTGRFESADLFATFRALASHTLSGAELHGV